MMRLKKVKNNLLSSRQAGQRKMMGAMERDPTFGDMVDDSEVMRVTGVF
jgi:hypothetical protein